MKNKKSELSSKDRLFRSAAALFANKGFRDVSVREIAAHAKVNSALVGYYFRGKQALFNEVYRAHTVPLSRERMRRLADLTRDGGKPSVEEILKAWLIPWLQRDDTEEYSSLHLRFTANISTERWKHTKRTAPYMTPTFASFMNAFRKCLPYLSKETLMWRLHFVTGAIAFGLRGPNPLLAFSKGRCDPTDAEATLSQMIPYAAAGFCAPEPAKAIVRRPAKRSLKNSRR
jgi:AcrR family transcriptional regulator